jgi:hypothetical protein
MEMDEGKVIYNTYYEYFEEFKMAVMGFFTLLPQLSPTLALGMELRSRIRDKFTPIGAPAANF